MAWSGGRGRRVKFLGYSSGQTGRNLIAIVGFSLWILLVNLCYLWLITPLVLDLALLGIVLTVFTVILWLTSIPKRYLRRWLIFTVFSILLAHGLASLTKDTGLHTIVWTGVMLAGLIGLTCWFGRVPLLRVIIPSLVLVAANWLVPIRDWPFLTQFSIAYDQQVPLNASAYPKTPLMTARTAQGQAIVTLQTAGTPTGSFLHQQYQYMELVNRSGQIQLLPATPNILANLSMHDVIGASSPLFPADWSVQHGRLIAQLTSLLSTADYASLSPAFVDAPVNMTAIMQKTANVELNHWKSALQELGVSPIQPSFVVRDGRLQGHFKGRKIDIPVAATTVAATGAFTQAGKHQLLLEGLNLLQVISLDGSPRVVATYHVNRLNPLAGNMVIAPIDATSRDVIYINGSPARILAAEPDGKWQVLYQAPNPNLRFLAAVRFAGEQTPEILTDDSSYMQGSSAAEYLTSYHYHQGKLIRNWRIYRSDLTDATTARFVSGGPTQLVAVLGGQHIAVLRRRQWPAVPIAAGLFGLSLVIGWSWRLRERRRPHA